MSHQVVEVRREAVAPCMTCPLCHKLFRSATTIIECLHTFCRKCINKKLADEEMECCPVCNIHLGCVPLEKLRLDHNLQDLRAKIFPYKRMKVKAPEVESPVTLPAKRKERSLSSLVVSTPRVSTQSGVAGRRLKSITRKASRGSSVNMEDNSMEDLHESSSSQEPLHRPTQNMRQSSAGEPSNHPSPDKGRERGSETWEGKVDLWKPLNCLVEAANRSKSSKFSIQGSVAISEAPNSNGNEGLPNKSKSKENRPKSKVQDDKNRNDHIPPDSERPKKLCRIRQKKDQNSGEFRIPPQAVLDAAGATYDGKSRPIWFTLVSDGQEGDKPPLPQIAASYLRLKDRSMPVSFIQKYLKLKLELKSEDEVEIKCMGQPVIPTLSLGNLVDLWLQTTTTDKVSAKLGTSAKDFVIVLNYARKIPEDHSPARVAFADASYFDQKSIKFLNAAAAEKLIGRGQHDKLPLAISQDPRPTQQKKRKILKKPESSAVISAPIFEEDSESGQEDLTMKEKVKRETQSDIPTEIPPSEVSSYIPTLYLLTQRRATEEVADEIPEIHDHPDLVDIAVRARVQIRLRFLKWDQLIEMIRWKTVSELMEEEQRLREEIGYGEPADIASMKDLTAAMLMLLHNKQQGEQTTAPP